MGFYSDRFGFSCSLCADGEEAALGFDYQDALALEGMASEGQGGNFYYEGGGYAYDLGRTQASALTGIEYLIANDWIDEYTRAIFVDFTTFNNQLNLYSVSFIMFEMFPTGGLFCCSSSSEVLLVIKCCC